MAFLQIDGTVRSELGRALRARFAAFWSGLATGYEAYLERHSRLDEVRRLQALSDAELARRGIDRDRIVHHVFRDKFGF